MLEDSWIKINKMFQDKQDKAENLLLILVPSCKSCLYGARRRMAQPVEPRSYKIRS